MPFRQSWLFSVWDNLFKILTYTRRRRTSRARRLPPTLRARRAAYRRPLLPPLRRPLLLLIRLTLPRSSFKSRGHYLSSCTQACKRRRRGEAHAPEGAAKKKPRRIRPHNRERSQSINQPFIVLCKECGGASISVLPLTG